MKVQYSSEFKRLVLQRLLADPEVGTRPLARELGVAKSTIWSWQQELAKVTEQMPPTEKRESYNGVKPRSADDKMELVIKSSALTGEAQARYLRTNGITDGDIAAWRNEMLQGLTPVVIATKPKSTKKDAARIATLEKQLRSANALLELKKKWICCGGYKTRRPSRNWPSKPNWKYCDNKPSRPWRRQWSARRTRRSRARCWTRTPHRRRRKTRND